MITAALVKKSAERYFYDWFMVVRVFWLQNAYAHRQRLVIKMPDTRRLSFVLFEVNVYPTIRGCELPSRAL